MLKVARDTLEVSQSMARSGSAKPVAFEDLNKATFASDENAPTEFGDLEKTQAGRQISIENRSPAISDANAQSSTSETSYLHKGQRILLSNSKFEVAGMSFDSLVAAKQHINQMK